MYVYCLCNVYCSNQQSLKTNLLQTRLLVPISFFSFLELAFHSAISGDDVLTPQPTLLNPTNSMDRAET